MWGRSNCPNQQSFWRTQNLPISNLGPDIEWPDIIGSIPLSPLEKTKVLPQVSPLLLSFGSFQFIVYDNPLIRRCFVEDKDSVAKQIMYEYLTFRWQVTILIYVARHFLRGCQVGRYKMRTTGLNLNFLLCSSNCKRTGRGGGFDDWWKLYWKRLVI